MEFFQHELESPVGIIYIISDGTHLRGLDFEGNEDRLQQLLRRYYRRFTMHAAQKPIEATAQLKDYFAGDLSAIDDILVGNCGTPFQQEVWASLRTIPAGMAISYGTLATRISRPSACRAVGLANGSNPVSIVVPCHRVIGANNTLTGYGGGIERKQWLLEHEGVALGNRVNSLV